MRWLISALVFLCAAGQASAQTKSAYAVGLDLAHRRGYDNANCYATVFARHAVKVEKANGRRGWFAASTPAYNAEQRQHCGIDRLSGIRAEREAGRVSGEASSGARAAGGAYRQGLRIARQRGYSGAKADCLARVFVRHATLRPSPFRAGVVDWSARSGPALRGEMHSICGISI